VFSTHIDISQWIFASGVLIILLFLFAYAVRFVANKQPQTVLGMKRKRMRLIESLHLDARNKICIIEMDDTEVILAVGANGFETIGTQEKVSEPLLEEEQCAPGRMEGVGFLKKFITGSCPVKVKNNTPEKDTQSPKAKPKQAAKKDKK
tara:strand:+ start:69464 stop:69910 length:447 start_codon:yes stop_codon:yes gene_type:complete